MRQSEIILVYIERFQNESFKHIGLHRKSLNLLLRTLTSIHFNVFLKKVCNASPVPSTVYNPKSRFLLVGFGTATICNLSNTKFSLKYFNVS